MEFDYISSEFELSTVNPCAFCSPDTILQCFTQSEVWLMEQVSSDI